jgi:hypothetical protein
MDKQSEAWVLLPVPLWDAPSEFLGLPPKPAAECCMPALLRFTLISPVHPRRCLLSPCPSAGKGWGSVCVTSLAHTDHQATDGTKISLIFGPF